MAKGVQVAPQITFKGLDPSAALQALIRRRLAGLEQLNPRIVGCRVVVEVCHRSAAAPKAAITVAVEVEFPGRNTLVGKDTQARHEAKGDHTAALNNAFNAVERQLEKAARREHGEVRKADPVPQTGMIVRLFPEQGYGFIEIEESPELYFTRNSVVGGDFEELAAGMLVHVTPATEEGPFGPQASSIRLLDKRMTPA
jgi:ribosome-associated translation inhibitor RaiA/cold shock CspA family protein